MNIELINKKQHVWFQAFTRSHLKIRACAQDQGAGRSSSGVYTLVNEQRRANRNAEIACRIDFETASSRQRLFATDYSLVPVSSKPASI